MPDQEKEQKRHTLRTGTTVQELVPQRGSHAIRVDADTEVLCIHRGTEPLEDMWDSQPFVISPGYFKTKYGAAKHFRDRAVVPGSRNPETHHQASFIAIIGTVDMNPVDGTFIVTHPIDDPREWERFNDEERAEYEDAQEALDRGAMVNAIDPDVQFVSTSSVIAGRPTKPGSRIKGGKVSTRPAGGSGKGASARPDVSVTDPDVMRPIPPEENTVLREARIALGQAAAEGHRVE